MHGAKYSENCVFKFATYKVLLFESLPTDKRFKFVYDKSNIFNNLNLQITDSQGEAALSSSENGGQTVPASPTSKDMVFKIVTPGLLSTQHSNGGTSNG